MPTSSGTLTSRRRFIRIAAAFGVGLAVPGMPAGAAAPARHWRGRLLGAEASLQLYHEDAGVADRAIAMAVAEVRRLEALFSLYDESAAIVRLNRQGILEKPPGDLVDLLATCREMWQRTGGLFDPTVQPLFVFLADHFARNPDVAPDPDGIGVALSLAGFDKVRIRADRIWFDRPGMALTLNGIAQGYITDRARAILAEQGFVSALVNMGEYAALGAHPDGRPWRLGVADALAPWQIFDTIPVKHGALATSAPAGAAFDRLGRFNHLLDPRSGWSAKAYHSVTVAAGTATLADALSTSLTLVPPAEAEAFLSRFEGVGALLRPIDGPVQRINL